jgi:hypothetical protein
MSTYDVARLHLSLKLHFTTTYDYFEYNGKCKIKFIPQQHLFLYEKLDKKYKDNIKDFFIANFVEKPKIWINEFLSEESNQIYLNYKKRKESLGYVFKEDINYLIDNYKDLNKVLIVNKTHPILMKSVLQEKVSLETCIILNDMVHFTKVWDKRMDDVIWKEFRLKLTKFAGFVIFDKDKMKKILKTVL